MSFELSFSPEFFGDISEADPTLKKPTNLADAIAGAKVHDAWWHQMAEDVFGVIGERLSEDVVFFRAIETNSCTDLTSPVEVWIDPEGEWIIEVWDERDRKKYADMISGRSRQERRKIQEKRRRKRKELQREKNPIETIELKFSQKEINILYDALDFYSNACRPEEGGLESEKLRNRLQEHVTQD